MKRKTKIHLYYAGRVACGMMPRSSPMICDPARVTCERCRKTRVFKMAAAAKANRSKSAPVEQMELFREG